MDIAPDTAVAAPLLLAGADVLALLHRISTRRLDDLEPGTGRMTIFCDPRGRMLHRAAVARTREGVWLLRDDAPATTLAAHVDKHVFRDKVKLVDPPAGLVVRAVCGGFGLPTGAVEERDGVPSRVQVEAAFGYHVGAAVEAEAPGPVDDGAQSARILAGWPRHGHEIVEEFNPYDIGRAHEVHLAKGCYTGQESLLRLITYGGVRRGLARIDGDGAPPATPEVLSAGGAEVGRLTSVALREGGWIGLGVLRLDAIAPGTDLALEGGGTARIGMAFPESRPAGLPG